MLFPEEETVSSVVEKGTFYTPSAQTEFDEIPVLQKAMLMIIPGAVLGLILPVLFPGFTLTHFLASILLFLGFLRLRQENIHFKVCLVLSVVQLAWAVWSFLCANILQADPLPEAILAVLPYIAMGVGLVIFKSFWLGIRQLHVTAAPFVLIAACGFVLLIILRIFSADALLVAKICVASVCLASLIAAAVKLRK